jgi:hypothetical protein
MRQSFPSAHKQFGSEPVSEADYVRVQELIAKGLGRCPSFAGAQEIPLPTKAAKPKKVDLSQLKQLDWAILDILESCGETPPAVITETLGRSPATIRRHLSLLKKLQLVDFEGHTNSTRYWVSGLGLQVFHQKGVER